MLYRPAARGMKLGLERVRGRPLGLSKVAQPMFVMRGQRDAGLALEPIWNPRERRPLRGPDTAWAPMLVAEPHADSRVDRPDSPPPR
jgi:hypothetical protein